MEKRKKTANVTDQTGHFHWDDPQIWCHHSGFSANDFSKEDKAVKLSRDAITQNLRDAGCQESFIKGFLDSLDNCTPAEQERMLEQERRCILDKVHDEQRKLDCFDYLRYRLKTNKIE